MCNKTFTGVLLFSMMTLMALPAHADDWPFWRGADGTGVSSETDWVVDGKADPVWSTNVGLGYSSFVISENRLLTMGFDEEESLDSIYCFEAESGKSIWKHSFPSELNDKYHTGGTLSTPTIDDDRVYALGREGLLFCLQISDGKVLWEKNLMEKFDLELPTWMFSAAPLILGEVVYINVGRTLALNKRTGEPIWQTDKTGYAYSTPFPFDFNGRACLLVFNSDGLFVFDKADGQPIASYEWKTQYDMNIDTPLVIGNRIFITSGLNRGCALLEMTDDGLNVVWENKVMRSEMTGVTLWDGHIYGFDDKILKCMDLDGNEQWRMRGFGMGALTIANGKLLVITAKGDLIIADASPGGFAELSRTQVLKGGTYWTMPVLANGLIYVRNSNGDVVCRDHREAQN
ncbi:MAG: PQQ-binding-like beta-propeller repeat protein [Planctomycetota bacterium]|nr:PQQ-binding-like beta-propeller repeat protein [Planctomycetota bacterium]